MNRRNILAVVIPVVIFCALVIPFCIGATETIYRPAKGHLAVGEVVSVVKWTTTDVNDATTAVSAFASDFVGYLDAIVVDGTGTDAAFDVNVVDPHGIVVFSRDDFRTTSDPNRNALSIADTAGNDFLGVPIVGAPSIGIKNCDTSNLTQLDVYLYYREARKF